MRGDGTAWDWTGLDWPACPAMVAYGFMWDIMLSDHLIYDSQIEIRINGEMKLFEPTAWVSIIWDGGGMNGRMKMRWWKGFRMNWDRRNAALVWDVEMCRIVCFKMIVFGALFAQEDAVWCSNERLRLTAVSLIPREWICMKSPAALSFCCHWTPSACTQWESLAMGSGWYFWCCSASLAIHQKVIAGDNNMTIVDGKCGGLKSILMLQIGNIQRYVDSTLLHAHPGLCTLQYSIALRDRNQTKSDSLWYMPQTTID